MGVQIIPSELRKQVIGITIMNPNKPTRSTVLELSRCESSLVFTGMKAERCLPVVETMNYDEIYQEFEQQVDKNLVPRLFTS